MSYLFKSTAAIVCYCMAVANFVLALFMDDWLTNVAFAALWLVLGTNMARADYWYKSADKWRECAFKGFEVSMKAADLTHKMSERLTECKQAQEGQEQTPPTIHFDVTAGERMQDDGLM